MAVFRYFFILALALPALAYSQDYTGSICSVFGCGDSAYPGQVKCGNTYLKATQFVGTPSAVCSGWKQEANQCDVYYAQSKGYTSSSPYNFTPNEANGLASCSYYVFGKYQTNYQLTIVCTAPQIKNTDGTACIDPPKTCTYPQWLDTAINKCQDPPPNCNTPPNYVNATGQCVPIPICNSKNADGQYIDDNAYFDVSARSCKQPSDPPIICLSSNDNPSDDRFSSKSCSVIHDCVASSDACYLPPTPPTPDQQNNNQQSRDSSSLSASNSSSSAQQSSSQASSVSQSKSAESTSLTQISLTASQTASNLQQSAPNSPQALDAQQTATSAASAAAAAQQASSNASQSAQVANQQYQITTNIVQEFNNITGDQPNLAANRALSAQIAADNAQLALLNAINDKVTLLANNSGSGSGTGTSPEKNPFCPDCAKETTLEQLIAGTGKQVTQSDDSVFSDTEVNQAMAQAQADYQTQFNNVKQALQQKFALNITSGGGQLPVFDLGTIKGSHVVIDFGALSGQLSILSSVIILLALMLAVFILVKN